MSYFIAGYVIVWIGITGYIAHLGAVQHSLRKRVDALQELFDEQAGDEQASSRAA